MPVHVEGVGTDRDVLETGTFLALAQGVTHDSDLCGMFTAAVTALARAGRGSLEAASDGQSGLPRKPHGAERAILRVVVRPLRNGAAPGCHPRGRQNTRRRNCQEYCGTSQAQIDRHHDRLFLRVSIDNRH